MKNFSLPCATRWLRRRTRNDYCPNDPGTLFFCSKTQQNRDRLISKNRSLYEIRNVKDALAFVAWVDRYIELATTCRGRAEDRSECSPGARASATDDYRTGRS